VDNGMQYIPVTYYTDGRTGNDIQYLSQQEIMADVLREYDRYISIVADERNAMVFVDKNLKST
jgi:choline/glycine/proline betaine transport protein